MLSIAPGCVTSGTYNAKVAELDKLRADSAAERARLQSQLKEAQDKVAELERRLADTEAALQKLTEERNGLAKSLDDSTALVGQLKQRLEKLGQNVEKLTAERGQLASGLEEAKARLEELRRQKAAAEARAATFRKLVSQLRSMIDAGQLKVVIREGRMLIALPDDVLFDSGKTEIKPAGQVALGKIAQVLATVPDRRFLVAGHTDNVPIRRSSRFESNWELSAARAIEVVKFLIANGMRPQVLAAAGYGEFDPIAKNDTPEQRALNRRIEIILQPNLADLPSLEGLEQEAK
ncbi:MAG: OmpA family protein [Myxococcales bacterium]|nr:OmpA family protein [Myxococcota bacterium]MDW8280934.1 OmpA family protein [Myxococcales bacterium]